MKLGRVRGKIWSTIKSESISGYKLLFVDILDNKANLPLVVADELDAGIGDLVIITGGSSSRVGTGNFNLPIDGTVIGIIDEKVKNKEENICLMN